MSDRPAGVSWRLVVIGATLQLLSGVVLLKLPDLEQLFEDALRHLLVALIISARAAVTVAKLMIPETHQLTPGVLDDSSSADGLADAFISGTQNGLRYC